MTPKKTKSVPTIKPQYFLKVLRQQFFDAKNKALWPPAKSARARKIQAATQMPIALKAMIRAAALEKPLPNAAPNTALGRVRAAAAITNWPKLPSRVTTAWVSKIPKYRMFEVAGAINIMSEALANSGGGGGPRDWPPSGHG